MPLTPTDTLYTSQWYLARLGGIEDVWGEYSGAGVHVGVYDDGIEYTHADLAEAYDATRHVIIDGTVIDPLPVDGPHGTSVAGIIAAALNGSGTVGVAWGAGLTAVNIFSGAASTLQGFRDALGQLGTFDVTNHSWGYDQFFQPDDAIAIEAALFEAALATGRGGLGTISVKAAGNETSNANSEAIAASRSTVIVGAYDDRGDASYYSNYGANLLVSAPSNGGSEGQTTTDLTGFGGYSFGAYTNDFGGTSGATPVVTGVIALMLEANAGLGWRDVHTILAYSADEVGSGVGGRRTADEHHSWSYNAAGHWNGGGLHFSEDYGFGAVDAHAAVRMAEVWGHFGSARTSANEAMIHFATTAPAALPDRSTTAIAFDVFDSDFTLEAVDLDIDISHSDLTDLSITLTSPGGTTAALFTRDGSASLARSGWAWTFGVNAFRGEDASGTWTLTIRDWAAGYSGILNAAELSLYGEAGGAGAHNSVYHFTDEFAASAGRDSARRAIADVDGNGWIDGAALTSATRIDLAAREGEIDGVGVSLAGIDNVITGDGDDAIVGHGAANRLFGMRGNDTIDGRGGDDDVSGGAGADMVRGNSGDDRLRGDAGDDTLIGARGADLLQGGGEDDHLIGGGDADTISGGGGADVANGGGGSDRLFGQRGADQLSGHGGADLLRGGSQDDLIKGGGNGDDIAGGTGDDILLGGGGNDDCRGGAGHDTLDGGRGDDTLAGGDAADTFVFGSRWGHDVVADFEHGLDALDFRANGAITSLADLVIATDGLACLVADAADPANVIIITDAAGLIDPGDFLF